MDEIDNAENLAAQFHDRLSGIGREGSGSRGVGGQKGRKRGGRGGGGGERAGGGGGGWGSSRAVDISRALSRLLRHQAAAAGVPLDVQGFAPLDRVLAWGPLRSMHVAVAEVREVVATNDKQRFALQHVRDDGDPYAEDDPAALRIRANQGHSIATVASDAGLLEPIDDPATAPPVVCHGTFFAFWPAIETAGGLRRMTRNHVHCGCLESEPDAGAAGDSSAVVIPGIRRNAQLHVFLDVRRALREDPALKWWRAANGVVLTEGDAATGVVPTRFFQRVVVTRDGARLFPPGTSENAQGLVLWRDGEKVADLPAEVLAKARVPPGKQGLVQRSAAAEAARGKEQERERAREAAAATRGGKRRAQQQRKKKAAEGEAQEEAAKTGASAQGGEVRPADEANGREEP